MSASDKPLNEPRHPGENLDERVQALRMWIANRESVCPYAPGPASYVHLPPEGLSESDWADFYSKTLASYYATSVNGKPVERLILIPHGSWRNHDQARRFAIDAFWRLSAGYFKQTRNGGRNYRKAMARTLDGVKTCEIEGVCNPIVGKRVDETVRIPHHKSLFLSTFSPLYKSPSFFRYAPACALVLVSARALFLQRDKHEGVLDKINQDMLLGCLTEATGERIAFERQSTLEEAQKWNHLVARIYRATVPNWPQLPEPDLGEAMNLMNLDLINRHFEGLLASFPLMQSLIRETGAKPSDILKAASLHAGLYVTPKYL